MALSGLTVVSATMESMQESSRYLFSSLVWKNMVKNDASLCTLPRMLCVSCLSFTVQLKLCEYTQDWIFLPLSVLELIWLLQHESLESFLVISSLLYIQILHGHSSLDFQLLQSFPQRSYIVVELSKHVLIQCHFLTTHNLFSSPFIWTDPHIWETDPYMPDLLSFWSRVSVADY